MYGSYLLPELAKLNLVRKLVAVESQMYGIFTFKTNDRSQHLAGVQRNNAFMVHNKDYLCLRVTIILYDIYNMALRLNLTEK